MAITSDESYQAPALNKGLEILEFLSGRAEPYALSELARALGKSRSEIYRMVIALERLGYLVRSDGDRFALTRKLFDLAMRTPPQRNLLVQSLPVMQSLSDETFQSCHVMVASGPDMVAVARIESPDMLGFSVRVGYRRPLNQSAGGHVVFAFLDAEARASWRAVRTARDDEPLWLALEREAAAIRQMGFYLSPSPFVDAVTDIAAPITLGRTGAPIAALIMPFIGGRAAKISLTQAASATQRAAQHISEALG